MMQLSFKKMMNPDEKQGLNKVTPKNKQKDVAKDLSRELDKNPLIYFYNMFSSHVTLGTMTWGDLYRLMKYYRMYSKWADRDGVRMYLVFPNLLLDKDFYHMDGLFFYQE